MQSHEILQKVIVSTKVIDQEYALWKLLLLFANLNLRVVSVRNCMIYSSDKNEKERHIPCRFRGWNLYLAILRGGSEETFFRLLSATKSTYQAVLKAPRLQKLVLILLQMCMRLSMLSGFRNEIYTQQSSSEEASSWLCKHLEWCMHYSVCTLFKHTRFLRLV